MTFDIQLDSSGTVLVSGRLDAAEAENARDLLRTLNGPVIVNCEKLEYISSAGLSVLVETYKRLTATGHALRLTGMQPRVRNVFALSGLDRILTIE
jgi:anti-anti-sigma factor